MLPVLSGFVFAAEQNLIGKRRALRRSGAHKCPVRMQKRPETAEQAPIPGTLNHTSVCPPCNV